MIQIEPSAQDTSKPTVLIENLFAEGTLTASTEAVGAEAANAAHEGTFDFWTPTAMPATFAVDMGVARDADCLCIAAHDLGSKGATLTLETWNGAGWDAGPSIAPTDDSTIMVLFPLATNDQWRLSISGPTAINIGYAALGRRIVLPGIVGDYTPTDWGERIEVLGGLTQSGQFLPQRVLSYGAETTVNLGRIEKNWHKQKGRAFQRHYDEGRAFFFAGWPDVLADDIAMCWRGERRQEMRTSIIEAHWMAMSFDVDCYVPTGLTYSVTYDSDVWILAANSWDDSGVWQDSETWND